MALDWRQEPNMAAFISYSHKDAKFVDRLAHDLIDQNIHIFLDRWELKVGDSLVQKIQVEIDRAEFLCVVMSEHFVNSGWCEKELNSGIMRELEEKKVIVLPLLIENCEIPLFLREKKYADFRSDYKIGFDELYKTLAPAFNPTLGRLSDDGNFHTDWAIDWRVHNKRLLIEVELVSFSRDQDWSVICHILIEANDVASARYQRFNKEGLGRVNINTVLLLCGQLKDRNELRLNLSDAKAQKLDLTIGDETRGVMYDVHLSCRRLGRDTGNDVVFHLNTIFADLCTASIELAQRQGMSDAEKEALKQILSEEW